MCQTEEFHRRSHTFLQDLKGFLNSMKKEERSKTERSMLKLLEALTQHCTVTQPQQMDRGRG